MLPWNRYACSQGYKRKTEFKCEAWKTRLAAISGWPPNPTSTSPMSLTKHSVTISLTAGRWTYYTNLRAIHYFRVTA